MEYTDRLAAELNNLYFTDPQSYLRRLDNIKAAGYKVLRNSAGQHKVQGIAIEDLFGGMFGDYFGGKYTGGK